jgi:uncharacterized C2H2 Zn-finger protein
MADQGSSETVVKCPVEGCDAEKLSRGIYLHVRQSKGGGHGPQGDIPNGLNLDNLESAGSQEVSMDYPDTRKRETVGRKCPYCDQIFKGKRGVMVHLGRAAGDNQHPKNPKENHDGTEFETVRTYNSGSAEHGGESSIKGSEVKRRLQRIEKSSLRERVEEYIADLRDRGKEQEAEKAEAKLLK